MVPKDDGDLVRDAIAIERKKEGGCRLEALTNLLSRAAKRTQGETPNVVGKHVGHASMWATLKPHQKLENSYLNILTTS